MVLNAVVYEKRIQSGDGLPDIFLAYIKIIFINYNQLSKIVALHWNI